MAPVDPGGRAAPVSGPRRVLTTALKAESGIWRSLGCWVRRRPIGVGDGAHQFGYLAAAAPVLWVFIGLSAFEIPLLHFVLPWPTARVVFLLLGAWGLLWMIGLLASFHVHPHVLGPAGIRVRNSLFVDVLVPWDGIDQVRPHRRTLAKSSTVQLEEGPSGAVVHICVSSMTNVEIVLAQPIDVPVPRHGQQSVSAIRLYADDPAGFVAAARDRISAADAS